MHPDVLLHPSAVRAALLTLLNTERIQPDEDLLSVSVLTDHAAPAYVVTAAPSCAAFLALELGRLIGRALRTDRTVWILSNEDAEHVVKVLGGAS